MEERFDEEIDVLVVGSGFAGLTAAIEACNNNASVIVIEKMNTYGGNSVISDGGIAACDTKLQAKYGIIDSKKRMYEDMLKAGMGLNQPHLLDILVSKSKEAFEWSVDYLNVPYLDRVDIFGGHTVARCYTPVGITGATIIKKMIEKINELKIDIRYRNLFKEFIVNEDNNVIGVRILENHDFRKPDSGTIKVIKINNGVILAAGGYGADIQFRKLQDPRLNATIDTTNKPFATAEALKEAIRIGGAPVQLSQIQLGAWSSPDERGFGKGPFFADYILFQYGMIIDPDTGRRFVNELGDRKIVSDALISKKHPCIGIADQQAVDASGWNIDKAIKKNVVRKFDTLEEISSFYSINPDILIEEINKYNSYVINKNDLEYNKLIVDEALPINKPPYYVMRLWPKVHFTMGGISINEKAQVTDYDGNIIENLYAAGEVVGGVHGASRLGSCAVTECLVFGRIAGKNVVKN